MALALGVIVRFRSAYQILHRESLVHSQHLLELESCVNGVKKHMVVK
jgi:hypothetical protein